MLLRNSKVRNRYGANDSDVYGGKVFGIKRNIKVGQKINPQNNRNKPFTIASGGLGKYDYPHCDKVPAGLYFSEIMKAEVADTSRGNEALKVYYKLIRQIDFYNMAIGKIDSSKCKCFYVIQSYPLGTQFYEAFAQAMEEALDDTDIELEDIKGVTERVSLGYGKSDIGGFNGRSYIGREEYIEWCIRDKQEKDQLQEEYLKLSNKSMEVEEALSECEEIQSRDTSVKKDVNLLGDAEDDFDDFYDDTDDEW